MIMSPRFDSNKVKFAELTKERAIQQYCWDAIIDKYEALFVELTT